MMLGLSSDLGKLIQLQINLLITRRVYIVRVHELCFLKAVRTKDLDKTARIISIF